MDLQSFCRAIPKAELRVHFTGAVPLDTFLLLARVSARAAKHGGPR